MHIIYLEEFDFYAFYILNTKIATGGADGILYPIESGDEHLIENFHSSRTIRKLILDCPSFASTLWNTALKGKCEIWADGHRLANLLLLF